MYSFYCCSSLQDEGKYIWRGPLSKLNYESGTGLLKKVARWNIKSSQRKWYHHHQPKQKGGISSRREVLICCNWFNESTPFHWFLFTSTTNIISIHWLDVIGPTFEESLENIWVLFLAFLSQNQMQFLFQLLLNHTDFELVNLSCKTLWSQIEYFLGEAPFLKLSAKRGRVIFYVMIF